MDKKKVIDDNGVIYYVTFRVDDVFPNGDIEYIELWQKYIFTKTNKEKLGFFDRLRGVIPKVSESNLLQFKLVHTSKVDLMERKPMDDYSISQIKNTTYNTIADYLISNENKNSLDSWDGILSSDVDIRKKLNRDMKIDELLNGDYSKLENYLNN